MILSAIFHDQIRFPQSLGFTYNRYPFRYLLKSTSDIRLMRALPYFQSNILRRFDRKPIWLGSTSNLVAHCLFPMVLVLSTKFIHLIDVTCFGVFDALAELDPLFECLTYAAPINFIYNYAKSFFTTEENEWNMSG